MNEVKIQVERPPGKPHWAKQGSITLPKNFPGQSVNGILFLDFLTHSRQSYQNVFVLIKTCFYAYVKILSRNKYSLKKKLNKNHVNKIKRF